MLRYISVLAMVLMIQSNAKSQTTITSATSGNWMQSSTWVGGTVPSAGDNAIIASGHTITLTAAVDITTGNLTVTGTLNLAGFDFTAGSLAGAGNIGSASGIPLVTVGSNGSSTTYSGVFSGAGARLTKTGSGTLTLSGANTYGGATIVSGGTIVVNHIAAMGSTSTLSLTGTGSVRTNLAITMLNTAVDITTNTAKFDCNGFNSAFGQLSLGGVFQPAGTYGSTASTATLKNNDYFTSSSAGHLTTSDWSLYRGGSGNGDAASISSTETMSNFWTGTLSSADWNTASNWTRNNVPATGDDIIFSSAASNHLLPDNSKTIGSINFNSSGKKVILGNFDVTVNGTISGAGSASYFQTNSSGSLKSNIANTSTFVFAVGNGAYNPVSITNNTGATDDFSLRVRDLVQYNVTWGWVVMEPHVQRTWFITKTNPNTGSGVDFVFNWNNGEETPGITSHKLYHHDGTFWQKQTGSTSVSGNTLTYNGYTGTFSPFTIGDDVILLPVAWLDFGCEATKEGPTQLSWRTAMESNTRAFVVERSVDGNAYHSIGEVAAAGNSQTMRSYSFTDLQPLPTIAYYRVRLEDMDDNISYSDVCRSNAGAVSNPAPLKVFPNPTNGGLYIMALEPERNFMWELFSATGQRVASGNSKDGQVKAELHHLSEGIYHLKIIDSSLSETHRILIRR